MSYEGTQVFAASELGTRIQPWWNVRAITPHGETGPLVRYPRRFARPVEGGPARSVATLYGRKIGPHGAEGPVEALGTIAEEWRATPTWKKAVLGGFLAGAICLAALKPLTENPSKRTEPWTPKTKQEAIESLEIIRVGAHCGEAEAVESWLRAIEVKYPSLTSHVRTIREKR